MGLNFDELLQDVSKKQTKIKATLAGISHSGKTYTALELAYGITQDWTKIVGIDIGERNGLSLYADKGAFKVLKLPAPYTPEQLADAVKYCESKGFEAIVIDSLTNIYSGDGGVLEIVDSMNAKEMPWKKVAPRLKKCMSTILTANCHIFCTLRQKSDKVMEESDNGKKAFVKKGMKDDFKPDSDYDFDLVLEMSRDHHAFAHKDRTRLLPDNQWFEIGEEQAKMIAKWTKDGINPNDEYLAMISTHEIVKDAVATPELCAVATKNKTLWIKEKGLWYSIKEGTPKVRTWVDPKSPKADYSIVNPPKDGKK